MHELLLKNRHLCEVRESPCTIQLTPRPDTVPPSGSEHDKVVFRVRIIAAIAVPAGARLALVLRRPPVRLLLLLLLAWP